MKKIMFNDRYGLTQAVISGRKTQTRRLVPESLQDKLTAASKQVLIIPTEFIPDGMDPEEFAKRWLEQPQRPVTLENSFDVASVDPRPAIIKKYSRYQAGDIVAVARSYKDMGCHPGDVILNPDGSIDLAYQTAGWKNKMFVRASQCVDKIVITNVGIQRLQDISEADCMMEGIERYTCNLHEYRGVCYSYYGDKNKMGTFTTARDAFHSLIDNISGKGTWDRDPWVFAYDFV